MAAAGHILKEGITCAGEARGWGCYKKQTDLVQVYLFTKDL